MPTSRRRPDTDALTLRLRNHSCATAPPSTSSCPMERPPGARSRGRSPKPASARAMCRRSAPAAPRAKAL
eukprot:6279051-Alexandrium_andersonii.AAC.1